MRHNDDVREELNFIIASGGRCVAGDWKPTREHLRFDCLAGQHHQCSGVVFGEHGPVGLCICPCHDDTREADTTALGNMIEVMGLWRVGDFVTTLSTGDQVFEIKGINHYTQVCVIGVRGGSQPSETVEFSELRFSGR